jgi:hypothetical protein
MGNKLQAKVRNTQKRTLNDVTTTQRFYNYLLI